METSPAEGFSGIEAYYQHLSPLDRSREVYLAASIPRVDLEQSTRWDNDYEKICQDYARSLDDYVNSTISDSSSSEEIEDIIVGCITSETKYRWQAYTAYVSSADKTEAFMDSLATNSTVTFDSDEKAQHVRESWRKCLENFGSEDAEFIADVRAELVGVVTRWDMAKEIVFLREVLASDEHPVAA